jgi:hypothetical protein
MLEEHVVHGPEVTLRGSRLGRLRGVTRVRVLWTWKVSKHETQAIAKLAPDLLYGRVRPGAEGALEITVLDERDRRFGWPEDVVAFGIHRRIENADVDVFHGLLSRC